MSRRIGASPVTWMVGPSYWPKLREELVCARMVLWHRPHCCSVWQADDDVTGTCEIDLLGKLGVV